MGAEEKPWFGKRCARCEAAINYAQAAKGVIPGLCGKCTDETRRLLREELRREIASENPVVLARGARGAGGGGGKLVAGIVTGLLLGLGAGVATAAYAPEHWGKLVSALKKPGP